MMPEPEESAASSAAHPMQQFQEQLNHLTERVSRIEATLRLTGAVSPSPAASPSRPHAGVPTAPAGPCGSSVETATPSPRLPAVGNPRRSARESAGAPAAEAVARSAPGTPAGGRGRSTPQESAQWEALIGGKWALWVGSVAVFLAVAFFLAYAWHALSDGGRLAVGFVAGFAFLSAGARTRGRADAWFSEGLTGSGLALQYLSLWAGAQRYGLFSMGHAFWLMTAVTVLGVGLSVRYDAVSLSALATLGGFLTPALLHSSGPSSGQNLSLFTHIGLLDTGILAVSLFKRWPGVIWLSFAATIALLIGWAGSSYTPTMRWTTFAFVTVYFLLFMGAACFYSLLRREETRPADLLLLFADAFAYAVAGTVLLHGALGSYPGAFPLALALLFALVSVAADRLAPENTAFGSATDGLALFFASIAIPIQLHLGWITIAWSVEAVILLTLGLQRAAPLLQRAGQVVWVLSLLSLAVTLLQAEAAPHLLLLNGRALPLLVSVLASGWMAVAAGANGQRGQGSPARDRPEEDDLARFYAAAAVLGGAWLIAQETYLGFSWRSIPLGTAWQADARYAIASLWAVYSAAVYALGCRLRHADLRGNALVVAGLAVVLPPVIGLGLPDPGWVPFANLRWLSFALAALSLVSLRRLAGRLERESGHAVQGSERELLLSRQWLLLPILLGLWGLTQETYASFRCWHGLFGAQWDRAAQVGISAVWTLCGTLLLIGGLAGRQAPVRRFGLALLGLAVCKVFLFDLSFLDMPYRTLSFGGLGLALIGISWLYSHSGERIHS